MKGHSPVADYVLVCSGSSDRQVKALADSVEKTLKDHGMYALGIEGYGEGKWILEDFGDVIVHIFHEGMREFYEIEKLWAFADEIEDI